MSGVRHLALLMRSLNGGGIERMTLNLARAFTERGYRVDLVVARPRGPLAGQVPEEVRLIRLSPSSRLEALRALGAARASRVAWPLLLGPCPLMLRRLPALVRYLRRARPDALLAAGTQSNLAALWARSAAGIATRIVISERNTMSRVVRGAGRGFRRRYPSLAACSYPQADAVVAVSGGVADDLAATAGLPRAGIRVIHNPVLSAARIACGVSPRPEGDRPPLVLSAGRLHRQKDFPTLLRAFARVRTARSARLIILGDGPLRRSLRSLAARLGVADDLTLPGFVDEPMAWMTAASVFVLSSAWEGFGNVLCEALACGCPVVSTDCPSGPGEILDGGAYGTLVPVGDDVAMAGAILATLDARLDRGRLRRRATAFSVDAAAERYLDALLQPRAHTRGPTPSSVGA
ncbi:MAG: glycosyltransferase [Gammaproteobacteria bacterium]|nr:glycosyltransferase [Gammaproteobacteria bacterium]NIR81635.1 glycosyltransferase [Gammaproteobacteria bacterium]NIR88186.1 glycosyltransferase [Gammaproteobacteria bacterium]NIU02747.1 glycosyltransferase [Gammaproteobacteria bacterium]NIV73346.1 glycosyltransferase [Gammaproteobacteria bacterium]